MRSVSSPLVRSARLTVKKYVAPGVFALRYRMGGVSLNVGLPSSTQPTALPARHPAKWVVDCKCVGSGEKALVYLGRYLYRGVIREQDILSCKDGQVRFRYRDSKTGKTAVRTMGGAAFLRLLLQPVLPKGFRRAANFGFLHPNSKRPNPSLPVVMKVMPAPVAAWMKPRPPLLCKCCGAPMQIVRRRLPPAAGDRLCGSRTAAGANM